MDIKEALSTFTPVITIPFPQGVSFSLFGITMDALVINESIVVSWAVMGILITASILLTRKLQQIPQGPQVFLEAMVEFLNTFSKEHFGPKAPVYGPYIGTIFLFLFLCNGLPALTPLAIGALHLEPPFTIKPPTRDLNVTMAFGLMTILIVFFGGLRAQGLRGWVKRLLSPTPMMVPFNLLEYVIRPLSLALRLFGNMLGGFIIMLLVEGALPVPFVVPAFLSLYFDLFDGLIQAVVFTFLSSLFIAEAVEVEAHDTSIKGV
ncbi:MAG: F0F1 ATP synthase subunit A [Spirochaetaceae bacterium]|jgi:F-type H+-transporting ATPase subunit a|nr:F0F1 ATP synthase subunit A [Spirochaetaceae bacterium]